MDEEDEDEDEDDDGRYQYHFEIIPSPIKTCSNNIKAFLNCSLYYFKPYTEPRMGLYWCVERWKIMKMSQIFHRFNNNKNDIKNNNVLISKSWVRNHFWWVLIVIKRAQNMAMLEQWSLNSKHFKCILAPHFNKANTCIKKVDMHIYWCQGEIDNDW